VRIFRPPTRDPIRAEALRTWLRKPPPACELCPDAERAEPSDLDGLDAERIFKCAQCGRLARPLPTDRSEFMEASR
jgi:hypothetical protein